MQLLATIHPQGGGKVTLSNPDGTVISVNPDGGVETRPKGTAGPWELCIVNGLTAIYQPDAGNNGPQYLFSLV